MNDQTPNPSAISLQRVRFAWRRGQRDVLDIDHLDIARASSVFIRGRSGAGKSTLLSLIAGVSVPREGEVAVLGQPISRWPGRARDRFRADHIGYVFQLFNLIPYLSVLDNVMLSCRFSALRARRARDRAGSVRQAAVNMLAALELADPALLQRPATELSIGQQQRVAVARALIGEPEVVIADEPTSALDELSARRFMTLLMAECERAGSTLLFVSHDRRLADAFDRQLALDEFNARASGTGQPARAASC